MQTNLNRHYTVIDGVEIIWTRAFQPDFFNLHFTFFLHPACSVLARGIRREENKNSKAWDYDPQLHKALTRMTS